MPTPAPNASPSTFTVTVRRMDPPDGPYAIRFEVRGGKGALRLARPGVLIDPPARQQAEEAGLTLAQLRTTRFLHVWDGGRSRVGHSLSRIDSAALEALPLGEWVELVVVMEQGAHYLSLPLAGPTVEEEPLSLEDGPTTPGKILHDFRVDVDAAAAARKRSGTAPSVPLPAASPPAPVARALSPDEPTELPVSLVPEPVAPPPNLATDPRPELLESPDGGAFEAGVDAWAGVLLHERNTTVVRHLRRRVRELEQRCAELEAQVAGAGGRAP